MAPAGSKVGGVDEEDDVDDPTRYNITLNILKRRKTIAAKKHKHGAQKIKTYESSVTARILF